MHTRTPAATPFRRADHRRLSFSELVFDMLNEGLISLAGYDPPTDMSAYGGFDLQRGDNDPAPGDIQWRYEGQTQSLVEGGACRRSSTICATISRRSGSARWPTATCSTPPTDRHSARPPRRRIFGAYLEAAVREFQIYAAMPRVARFATPRRACPRPDAGPSLGTA